MKKIDTDTKTLAFCIALLPPIWAVLAPHIGVSTGAVALICAGVYVAGGNSSSNAVKMSVGFLLGDLWAVAAIGIMDAMSLNPDLELFITLFVLGGLAVLISALCPKYIYCPSWLCGWAIGLTIMSPLGAGNLGSLPIQIGAAMLVGVWYVGALLDIVQKRMAAAIEGRSEGKKK
jgi:hypothetical protein